MRPFDFNHLTSISRRSQQRSHQNRKIKVENNSSWNVQRMKIVVMDQGKIERQIEDMKDIPVKSLSIPRKQ